MILVCHLMFHYGRAICILYFGIAVTKFSIIKLVLARESEILDAFRILRPALKKTHRVQIFRFFQVLLPEISTVEAWYQ